MNRHPMRTEPVLTVASVTSAATAVVAVLVAFGLPLTGDQQTAVLALVAVLAPHVAAWVARGRVTPWTPETSDTAADVLYPGRDDDQRHTGE